MHSCTGVALFLHSLLSLNKLAILTSETAPLKQADVVNVNFRSGSIFILAYAGNSDVVVIAPNNLRFSSDLTLSMVLKL